MKNILLISIITIVFTSIKSYSQENITISENEVQLLKNHGLSVYEVTEKEVYEYEYKHLDRIKELDKMIQKRGKNYLEQATNDYKYKLNKFNNNMNLLNKLKSKMDEYVASTKKHKDKMHLLVEAQEIANQYGIKFTKEYQYQNSRIVSTEYILLTQYSKNCIKNGLVQRFYDRIEEEINILNLTDKPHFTNDLKTIAELDSLKQFKTKRNAYIVGDVEHPITVGEYEIIFDNFGNYYSGIVDASNNALLEGKDIKVDNKDKAGKAYKLVRNKANKKYYYFSGLDLVELNGQRNINIAVDMVRELGYKEYKLNPLDSDHYYIKTKNAEIKVGAYLIPLLKNNKNYLTEFDNKLINLQGLMKQALSHSDKLRKHYRNYKLKVLSGLSSAEINAWVSDRDKALILSNKIYEMQQTLNNVPFTLLNKQLVIDQDELSDMILVSNSIL